MTRETRRVAIVTGGNGGLGGAIAARLLADGFLVVSWLASERCSFSTGAAFDLSGGRAVY